MLCWACHSLPVKACTKFRERKRARRRTRRFRDRPWKSCWQGHPWKTSWIAARGVWWVTWLVETTVSRLLLVEEWVTALCLDSLASWRHRLTERGRSSCSGTSIRYSTDLRVFRSCPNANSRAPRSGTWLCVYFFFYYCLVQRCKLPRVEACRTGKRQVQQLSRTSLLFKQWESVNGTPVTSSKK